MSGPSSTRPPVDEDVDDLDDVLEQFMPAPPQAQAKKASSSTASPVLPTSIASASAPTERPKAKSSAASAPTSLDDLDISADFARELAEGMASLMREIAAESEAEGLEKGKGGEPASKVEREQEEAFRRAWEAMLVESMNGQTPPESIGREMSIGKEKGKRKGTDTASSTAKEGEEGFRESINRTMERMRESEAGLHADSAGEEDALEQLLKNLSGMGGEGGEGGEPEEQLQGLLEGMMTQLMSKDVLYEPLKELHDKFPAYMKDHAATMKPEDKKRFESQRTVVAQIIAVFEDHSYSPDNVEQGVKIVTLMNEMQSYGSPPSEIMGPLPPGLELGADGLPKLPDGCVIA